MYRRLLLFTGLIIIGMSQATPLDDLLAIYDNLDVAPKDCYGTQVERSKLKYTLFTRINPLLGITLTDANLHVINENNRVIVIVPGWLQEGSDAIYISMKNSYLTRGPANVIIADWSFYAKQDYADAFCAVPQVGDITGQLIYDISTCGVSLNKVQMNGNSMGGHICGYAGRKVQALAGGEKIGRINGLDVAAPGYTNLPSNQRLGKTDANFVQGIHTNGGTIGFQASYGTVDVRVDYVATPATPLSSNNCGNQQYGCIATSGVHIDDLGSPIIPQLLCNNLRALAYFSESISSPSFLAVKCKSCWDYGTGGCATSPSIKIGEDCPATATGNYYLSANSVPPFARGAVGLVP